MHHLNSAWLAVLCCAMCVCVCRDLNQYTSQDVFLGPYLDDPAVRAKFSAGYTAMTDGFLVRRSAFTGLARMPGPNACLPAPAACLPRLPACLLVCSGHTCFALGCLLP
jgi:hypothetical protein